MKLFKNIKWSFNSYVSLSFLTILLCTSNAFSANVKQIYDFTKLIMPKKCEQQVKNYTKQCIGINQSLCCLQDSECVIDNNRSTRCYKEQGFTKEDRRNLRYAFHFDDESILDRVQKCTTSNDSNRCFFNTNVCCPLDSECVQNYSNQSRCIKDSVIAALQSQAMAQDPQHATAQVIKPVVSIPTNTPTRTVTKTPTRTATPTSTPTQTNTLVPINEPITINDNDIKDFNSGNDFSNNNNETNTNINQNDTTTHEDISTTNATNTKNDNSCKEPSDCTINQICENGTCKDCPEDKPFRESIAKIFDEYCIDLDYTNGTCTKRNASGYIKSNEKQYIISTYNKSSLGSPTINYAILKYPETNTCGKCPYYRPIYDKELNQCVQCNESNYTYCKNDQMCSNRSCVSATTDYRKEGKYLRRYNIQTGKIISSLKDYCTGKTLYKYRLLQSIEQTTSTPYKLETEICRSSCVETENEVQCDTDEPSKYAQYKERTIEKNNKLLKEAVLIPSVECITLSQDGARNEAFVAYFGYENKTNKVIELKLNSKNNNPYTNYFTLNGSSDLQFGIFKINGETYENSYDEQTIKFLPGVHKGVIPIASYKTSTQKDGGITWNLGYNIDGVISVSANRYTKRCEDVVPIFEGIIKDNFLNTEYAVHSYNNSNEFPIIYPIADILKKGYSYSTTYKEKFTGTAYLPGKYSYILTNNEPYTIFQLTDTYDDKKNFRKNCNVIDIKHIVDLLDSFSVPANNYSNAINNYKNALPTTNAPTQSQGITNNNIARIYAYLVNKGLVKKTTDSYAYKRSNLNNSELWFSGKEYVEISNLAKELKLSNITTYSKLIYDATFKLKERTSNYKYVVNTKPMMICSDSSESDKQQCLTLTNKIDILSLKDQFLEPYTQTIEILNKYEEMFKKIVNDDPTLINPYLEAITSHKDKILENGIELIENLDYINKHLDSLKKSCKN